MGNLKPMLIFTTVGFVLSFIVGLISGVSFLVLLFRALLVAVICGSFFFLVKLLLKKQLPELFENETELSEIVDPEKGQNLNIVLDEDLDHSVNEENVNLDEKNFKGDFESFNTTEEHVENELKQKEPEINFDDAKFDLNPVNAEPTTSTTIDELPNMDAYETSFDDLSSQTTADLVDAGTASLEHDTRKDFAGENVNNMARAIHTVLKKDST